VDLRWWSGYYVDGYGLVLALIPQIMDHRTTTLSDRISTAEAPWQNCIAVCQKCAGKLNAMDGEKTKLRIALKELIAERDLKKTVRAVDASCFDICPEEKITVMHFTPRGAYAISVEAQVAAPEILREFGY
jgi:hypothetical protein